ncbi:MAG: FAD-dependent oxidoreductase, partial [Verrucomicrobiota bacterium]
MRSLVLLLIAALCAGEQADVVVYGATPGGFCAAIAAAREGSKVILVEPTGHVGGLSTGGLSHCDSNQMRREALTGLFEEWHGRIVKDYVGRGQKAPYDPMDKTPGVKWVFEPHVAMRVTLAMLRESGVTVVTDAPLLKAEKSGARIVRLVTRKGDFAARTFVDGTYEGDLMAAAGVEWIIGREGRAQHGESLAGKQYPKPAMRISGFGDDGRPLPLITSVSEEDPEAGDRNVMTYSFRLCLTRDPAKKVPLPEPADYDPAKFELARRALRAGVRGIGFDLYPLPGDKLDGNNSIGGQISLGLVGGSNTWHEADETGRARLWEEHRQYTLEFLRFLRTDPSVPEKTRAEYASIGLCKDEFAATGHFPPALYVRESRRLKGLYVLTQKDIIDSPAKDDPVAVSSFPIDSHDCRRVALKDSVIDEGTIMPVRVPGTGVGYAYQVPYRAILPKPDQCGNLLVPVALSSTHVAMSSLRIEGAWMAIGQAAGVAAALSSKRGLDVQELPYVELRARQLAQGQSLELPPPPKARAAPRGAESIAVASLKGTVLDDGSARLQGDWSHSTNFR